MVAQTLSLLPTAGLAFLTGTRARHHLSHLAFLPGSAQQFRRDPLHCYDLQSFLARVLRNDME